ncbi:hypothetical protein NLG97_g7469 [Lecanicillium saksenae]|uniref:Uncharacterized protein n=1 Tax=Lecanicillium saksenae TaxID=468837 RepID=A0ACC1QP30_9HYPO|nr:hypothetical protein NLG97_g7469 [Lecanicillium saksenae]
MEEEEEEEERAVTEEEAAAMVGEVKIRANGLAGAEGMERRVVERGRCDAEMHAIELDGLSGDQFYTVGGTLLTVDMDCGLFHGRLVEQGADAEQPEWLIPVVCQDGPDLGVATHLDPNVQGTGWGQLAHCH